MFCCLILLVGLDGIDSLDYFRQAVAVRNEGDFFEFELGQLDEVKERETLGTQRVDTGELSVRGVACYGRVACFVVRTV